MALRTSAPRRMPLSMRTGTRPGRPRRPRGACLLHHCAVDLTAPWSETIDAIGAVLDRELGIGRVHDALEEERQLRDPADEIHVLPSERGVHEDAQPFRDGGLRILCRWFREASEERRIREVVRDAVAIEEREKGVGEDRLPASRALSCRA